MYVPHFEAILKNMGVSREAFDANEAIEVPAPLLKMLLQIVVACGEFNKEGYLALNPDIAEAVKSKAVPNPMLHYIQYGFFEGRSGACPPVDEAWYLKTYADIGDAVRKGSVASGSEHFMIQGAAEGRAPSEKFMVDALQWKKAFSAPGQSVS